MGNCTTDPRSAKDLNQPYSMGRVEKMKKDFENPVKYYDDFEVFSKELSLEEMNNRRCKGYSVVLVEVSKPIVYIDPIISFWTGKYENAKFPTLHFIHAIGVENSDSIMVPTGKLQMIMDKPILSLIHHPVLENKSPLDENEVWFILDCISSALCFKQQKLISCQDLSLNDIYQVKLPINITIYKLLDRIEKIRFSAIGQILNTENVASKMKELERNLIFSPIQMKSVQKGDKFPEQNICKTNVFQLGVIALHCLDGKPSSDIYDWEKRSVKVRHLQKRIDNLYGTTSHLMRWLLSSMLKIDENQRYDCIELDDTLTKLYFVKDQKRVLDVLSVDNFQYAPKKYKHQQIQFQRGVDNQRHLHHQQQSSKRETYSDKIEEQIVDPNQENQYLITPIYNQDVILEDYEEVIITNEVQLKQKKKIAYSNGYYYEGEVRNQERCGQGTLYDDKKQKVVEGEWLEDLPSGQAILYNQPDEEEPLQGHLNLNRADWLQYAGQVDKGLKHGEGELIFIKERFTGKFLHDKADGQGIFTYSDGKSISGHWKNNIFQLK